MPACVLVLKDWRNTCRPHSILLGIHECLGPNFNFCAEAFARFGHDQNGLNRYEGVRMNVPFAAVKIFSFSGKSDG